MFSKQISRDWEIYYKLDDYSKAREGALVPFFEALDCHLKGMKSHEEAHCNNEDNSNTDKYKDAEITLTAHSMGTIIANEVVARWPDIHYSKIILQ